MTTTVAQERYIMSCILGEPDILWEVSSVLDSKDFSLEANKYIFSIFKKLIENDQELDVAVIDNEITGEVRAVIQRVSPAGSVLSYIEALKNSPYSIKNLDDNLKKVKQASVRRQLINIFELLKRDFLVEDDGKSVGEIVAHCEDSIVDLGIDNEIEPGTHHVTEGLRDFVDERSKFPEEVPGIATGFSGLDRQLGGLGPGQLTVVVARPKVGKTSLLLNWAKHIAVDQEIPVLMLDTEMPTAEVNTRLLSMISGVAERKIITGLFVKNDTEKTAVEKALRVLENAPLYHIYMPVWDFDTILAYARKYKVRYNIGALFFDYIKLPDVDTKIQEYQHLGQLTTNLKNRIAGKLEIPVVTASQLNRMRLGEEIGTDQIGGSDRILHFANHLLALTRKSHEDIEKCDRKANTNLHILASRNAESGYKFDVMFKKSILRMSEIRGISETNEQWNEF